MQALVLQYGLQIIYEGDQIKPIEMKSTQLPVRAGERAKPPTLPSYFHWAETAEGPLFILGHSSDETYEMKEITLDQLLQKALTLGNEEEITMVVYKIVINSDLLLNDKIKTLRSTNHQLSNYFKNWQNSKVSMDSAAFAILDFYYQHGIGT